MARSKQARITISLPAALHASAKQMAKSRRVSLGMLVATALDNSAHEREAMARERLVRLELAFSGFSKEELMILDGVDLMKRR